MSDKKDDNVIIRISKEDKKKLIEYSVNNKKNISKIIYSYIKELIKTS